MNSVDVKALAKVNLGLDVIRKREDGYHEVKMIMQTINMYDKLHLEKSKEPGIVIETNSKFLPTNENNLAYRAAALLQEQFSLKDGVIINLQKFIPVAAGMAGGSSDAAAVLYGMNRLFHLSLSEAELMKIGLSLGADIPFCIMRGTALAEGIGEKLTRLDPCPKCYVLIAKPPIGVSTREVYENLKLDDTIRHPDIDALVQSIHENNLEKTAALMDNVLESVTIPRYPVISKLKELMLDSNALNAMMSGSGPTVFGLFDKKTTAKKAFENIKASGLASRCFLTTTYNIYQ